VTPPGSRLHALASQWFDARTVATVFEPLIADLQHEWSIAAPAKRRWIAARGRIAFAVAFISAYPRVLGAPTPPGTVRRVMVRIAMFSAIAAVIGMVPVWRNLATQSWTGDASPGLIVTIVLVPLVPLITAFLPFAIAVGIDAIRGSQGLSPEAERGAVTKLLLAVTLWTIVGGGWFVPAVNQAWRTSVSVAVGGAAAGYVPPRGMRELSTYELVFHPDRAFVQSNRPGGSAARELYRRVALVLLPLLLVRLRWLTLAAEGLPRYSVAGAASMSLSVDLLPFAHVIIAWLLLAAFAFAHPWLATRHQRLA
jgi:hypothetical protein